MTRPEPTTLEYTTASPRRRSEEGEKNARAMGKEKEGRTRGLKGRKGERKTQPSRKKRFEAAARRSRGCQLISPDAVIETQRGNRDSTS